MATWTVYVTASGSAHDMTVFTGQKFGFFGDNWNDTITVGEYQHSMHIMTAGNDDECGNHPTNKIESPSYLPNSNLNLYPDSGNMAVNAVENSSLVKYHFNHASAVSTSGALFYGYQGAVATPPTELAFWAFEVDDADWSTASGNANALELTNQGSATDHDFFIGMSAGPETVGTKSGWTTRLEITYY